MADLLVRTVDRYNLRGKVSTFLCVTSPALTLLRLAGLHPITLPIMTLACENLQRLLTLRRRTLQRSGIPQKGVSGTISFSLFGTLLTTIDRCMEHAIHLGAGHFIKTVSPTSTPALMKKIKRAFHNAQMHGETVDLDALDTGLSGFDEEADNGSDQDDDGDDEESPDFGVGDTIGKALALVKQVGQLHSNSIIYINNASQIRSSPQARTFFNKSCKQADVPILELMLWVRTRWASMHSFLARMLLLQKVCISNLFGNILSSSCLIDRVSTFLLSLPMIAKTSLISQATLTLISGSTRKIGKKSS